jgi:hypothetical protein
MEQGVAPGFPRNSTKCDEEGRKIRQKEALSDSLPNGWLKSQRIDDRRHQDFVGLAAVHT